MRLLPKVALPTDHPYLVNKYTYWYYSIIEQARQRVDCSGYMEEHHIIPKSFYKSHDPILGWLEGYHNHRNNRISLTQREHLLLHRCLTKITSGIGKMKMTHALWWMVNRVDNNPLCARLYDIVRTQRRELMQSSKWWTNGTIDVQSPISPGSEWYNARSDQITVKGRAWWNNGIMAVRAADCPGEGWARGMLEEVWNKGKTIGSYWTNGLTYVVCRESPGEGWWKEGATKGKPRPHGENSNSNHNGTTWWHKGKDRKRSRDCPGDGWERGSGVRTVGTKGQQWWNDGIQSVIAAESPGPNWQLGRIQIQIQTGSFFKSYTCPTCGKIGQGPGMKNHFRACARIHAAAETLVTMDTCPLSII